MNEKKHALHPEEMVFADVEDEEKSVFSKGEVQCIKPYMFIKGFALGKNLTQTAIALPLAKELHAGQVRKGGEPYLTHPLKVCSTLISYGIDDDTTLAAALLHDTLEDCGDKLLLKGDEFITKYHLGGDTVGLIRLLSKEPGLSDDELKSYFGNIMMDPRAALIKLSDRLHNSSTLYNFTLPKMRKYIRETDKFLLPMASYCKKYYSQYANAFSILKSDIEHLNHSMDVMLRKIEDMGLNGTTEVLAASGKE